MSDEKSPLDDKLALEPATPGEVSKSSVSPTVVMVFIIMALLGALIAVSIRKHQITSNGGTAVSTSESSGLEPVGSESVEDIAKRVKTDTDTLVALTGRFQEILAEKDTLISAKNAEIVSVEKSKQTWVSQCERLQNELSKKQFDETEAAQLRNVVLDLKSERDKLTAQLRANFEQMKAMSSNVSTEDYADLQRKLTEAVRAKEFFESRVKELEGPPK